MVHFSHSCCLYIYTVLSVWLKQVYIWHVPHIWLIYSLTLLLLHATVLVVIVLVQHGSSVPMQNERGKTQAQINYRNTTHKKETHEYGNNYSERVWSVQFDWCPSENKSSSVHTGHSGQRMGSCGTEDWQGVLSVLTAVFWIERFGLIWTSFQRGTRHIVRELMHIVILAYSLGVWVCSFSCGYVVC